MKCWGFRYSKLTILVVIKVYLSNVHFNSTLTYYSALIMISHVRVPKLLNSTPNPLTGQVKPLGFKNKGLSRLTNVILSLDIIPIG